MMCVSVRSLSESGILTAAKANTTTRRSTILIWLQMVADEPEAYADADYQESEPEEDFREAFAIEDAEGEPDGQPEQSDMGASGDDEVFEAYAAMDRQRKSYRESRKRLKNLQKSFD